MFANRAIYHDGWIACTTPPVPPWLMGTAKLPDDVINGYKWELYNLKEDYSEYNDLAAKMPDKLRDMQELLRLPGGTQCASNQVLYHVGSRGIEYDLLPWCTEHKIPLMAYSPLGQGGRLLQSKALATVAKRHNATPGQIAIAWSMRHGNVITIPKASDLRHVRENAAAGAIALSDADLATIDAAHPEPGRKQSLDIS
jgi:aryl-alcohol dehydrogenase-like predicted oxidoreductase